MLRVEEFIPPDAYHAVPKIPVAALRWLWYDDFWDGPRSGLVQYGEAKCWVMLCDEEASETVWRFLVVALRQDQLAEEEHWHTLFQSHVGMHTTFDRSGQRMVGGLKPRDEWPLFYDAYRTRTPRDLSQNQVMGWFELP